jgi:predicted nucleic acid-binding protein
MKLIVCDASPLIFLAKLDRLNLIGEVLGHEVFVLQCVVEEVTSAKAGPLESERLRAFFDGVEVVDFEASAYASKALSQADQSTLTWAMENRADWLLADERLLRRIAMEKGMRVVGFLGLLLEAGRRGILTAGEVKAAIDDAVSKHGCRISIALYQRLLLELEGM